jgi:hypothetical protein
MLKYVFNSCQEIPMINKLRNSFLACDFCDHSSTKFFHIYYTFTCNNRPIFSMLKMILCEDCHYSYCCSCIRDQGNFLKADDIEKETLKLQLTKVRYMGRSHIETNCTICCKKIRKFISNGANIVCHSYQFKNSLSGKKGRYHNHLSIYLCDHCYHNFDF